MRVLFLAGNGGSGGLIAYINGLINAIDKLGNEFIEENKFFLICGPKLYTKLSQTKFENVEIVSSKYAIERGINIILDRKVNKQLITVVNRINPDLIYFMNGYTRRGFENYKSIMILHNQLYINREFIVQFGISKLTFSLLGFSRVVRKSMKRANGVIFLSEFSKTETDKKNIEYNESAIIPFGINKRDVLSKHKPIIKQIHSRKISLLYISAILPYKNHVNLVKSMSILKSKNYDIDLLIIGKKYKKTYNKLLYLIKKYNLQDNVNFSGWVNHKDINAYIDQYDIFIYASSLETTGLGLMEGMARGALIASSNKSGFNKILQDGGLYFNPESPVSISNSVMKLINSTENDKNMFREKNIKSMNKYLWDTISIEHLNFIKKIIN